MASPIVSTPLDGGSRKQAKRTWLGLTLLQWGLLGFFAAYLFWTGVARLDSFEHHLRMYRADLMQVSRAVILHVVICSGLTLMAAVFTTLVAALEGDRERPMRMREFAAVQTFLLLVLSADARFELAPLLEVNWRHAVHLTILLVEIGVLVLYRDLLRGRAKLRAAAAAGVVFSALVPLIDFVVPHDVRWHVWLEEGSRAAASLCWLYFGWALLRGCIRSESPSVGSTNSRLGTSGWVLAAGVAGFVLAGAFVAIVPVVTVHDRILGTIPLFHLDHEWSLPAFFSTALLLVASALAAAQVRVCEVSRSTLRFRWVVLSLGLFYMALDESISLHELTIAPLHALLPLKGTLFEFAWVLVAIPIVIAVGLYFLPMLRRLPPITRNRLILAGVVYVGGAVGVETFGGWTSANVGRETVPYQLAVVVEEGLEMAGLALLVRALLLQLPLPWPQRLAAQARSAA